MTIDGMTRLSGLLGNPVAHTLSPLIHNTISSRRGINNVYVPFCVEKEGLGDVIRGGFELCIIGFNVTVPHKVAVMEYLDGVDEMAAAIGAVNTLVRTNKGYKGYNTDAEGFIRELRYYDIDIKDKCAVLLGAGGAARAVAFALAESGASRIVIANRTREKSLDIVKGINEYFGRELAYEVPLDEVHELDERDYLAVQCTSIGLAPKSDECVISDGAFFDRAFAAVDVIYNPSCTRFMKYAKEHGVRAYNGLMMLIFQGIAAYEKFNKVTLDDADAQAVTEALSKKLKKNIILIGYMGSGKSAVSKALLKRLSAYKLVDTDALIEEKAGKSISDIFAVEGEAVFRDMETEVLTELLSCEESMIISTGGGMPMREENRRLMSCLGRVIYLTAEPATLYGRLNGDDKRPLLKSGDLKEKIVSMLMQRDPVYRLTADEICVTDDRSVDEVVEYIVNDSER